MLHRVKLEPLRLREFSELTGCEISRTVSWRWKCSCGKRGSWRKTWGVARAEGREHSLDLRRA